jgi:hypothetical protein
MKICVIGHPRTRSSHLMETMSFFYDIPIVGEDINELYKKLYTGLFTVNEVPQPVPDNYLDTFKNLLDIIKNSSSGIVRLHPTQLSLIPCRGKVLDFNLFEFNQYDKIIFTTRLNLADLISSYFVGQHLKRMTYKSVDEVQTNIAPKEFTSWYNFQIKMLQYSELIATHLKAYLNEHSISWEQYDYDDIPAYLETTYPGVKTTHVETKYNYPTLVTNYDELVTIYDALKPTIITAFYKENPQWHNVS